ncbi:uncharacterized protein G2W53_014017 [Senna tora]|uniref:Uncharacterized protein n=1 Tax=Senna tora TaxID=362788 RepID=A0A834U0M6_9FABA|nr:uncharacterized protein G2W53_014017 [Senna tora]
MVVPLTCPPRRPSEMSSHASPSPPSQHFLVLAHHQAFLTNAHAFLSVATRKMPAKSSPITTLLVSLLSSSCATTSCTIIVGVVTATAAASSSVGTFAGSNFQPVYEQYPFTTQYRKLGSRGQPYVSMVSLNPVSLSLGRKDTPSFQAFIAVAAAMTDSLPVDATTSLKSVARSSLKYRIIASLFLLPTLPAASPDHHLVVDETHQPAMVLASCSCRLFFEFKLL